MLSSEETRAKIFGLPDEFNEHYEKALSLKYNFPEKVKEIQHEYGCAKQCYDEAVMVSVFVQLSESDKIKLFGNRPHKDDSEELQDGLFMERRVDEVYWECIRAGKTWENEDHRIKK